MAKLTLLFALLLIPLLASTILARPTPTPQTPAQTYTDPAQRWSVQLPPGWTAADNSYAERANAFAAVINRNLNLNFSYTASLIPQQFSGSNTLSDEYILFQFTPQPLHNVPGAYLHTSLQATDKVAVTHLNWNNLRNPNLGFVPTRTIIFDPDRNRGYFALAFTYRNIDFYGACVMIPTRNGFVQINAYAPFDKMPAMRQRLMAIADSFTIPPEYAWSPDLFATIPNWFHDYPIPFTLAFASLCAVTLKLLFRPKPQPDPDTTPEPAPLSPRRPTPQSPSQPARNRASLQP